MDAEGARTYILDRLARELDAVHSYHCLEHTLDVHRAAMEIADAEGVEDGDRLLLSTAAVYHDAGFLVTAADHETAGCALVREVLPRFGFSQGEVDRVVELIEATATPQQPKDPLQCILCDADLDYLGREDFKPIGDKLFAELKAFGRLADEREWDELQLRFIGGHRYFTATNQARREAGKQRNLATVRARLAR